MWRSLKVVDVARVMGESVGAKPVWALVSWGTIVGGGGAAGASSAWRYMAHGRRMPMRMMPMRHAAAKPDSRVPEMKTLSY